MKSSAEMLEQKLVWIVFTSSPLILWKVFSCACHIFGALRSRETCGPVLPREHEFPCGFPVPSTFALYQSAVHSREQGARSVLRLLIHTKTCGGCAPPQLLISVLLKSIFGDQLQRKAA